MSCWQILGIEPTADERTIRRAYAKKLKTTRPDEDPQGYQKLREAFDYALSIAHFYEEEEEELEQQEPLFAEENQQDYFSANQDLFVKESDENLLSDLNQEEQQAPFISEMELIAAMVAQEKQDWCSSPVEMAQPVQTEAKHNYAEVEPYSGERLYWEIHQRYQEEGSQSLLENWELISQQFGLLPLGEEDAFSWNLLRFLIENEINEPELWFKCSEYFNWLGDYRIGENLSPDSLFMLETQVNEGKRLINKHAKQNFEVIEIPPDYFPISQAIYYRLGSFWQSLIMYFYGFFLYPALQEEMRNEWWKNNGKKFSSFMTNISAIRVVIFIIGIITCFGISIYLRGPEIFVNFITIYAGGVISFLISLFFVLLVCKSSIKFFDAVIPNKVIVKLITFIKNPKFNFFVSILFPIAFYFIIVMLYKSNIEGNFIIVLFLVLSLCSSIFAYYTWGELKSDYYSFYFIFFVFYNYLNSKIKLGELQELYFISLFLLAVIWQNTVMYLFHFYNNGLWALENYIIQPFKQAHYNWTLLLLPFRLIRSAILWLFLIPFYTLRSSLSANIELAIISLLIIYISGLPLLIIFFFPITMLVYGVYILFKNKLLRKLEVIK